MITTTITTAKSRLRAGDVLRVGSLGLRSRRMRTSLSTLGVAIGIASMVAVLGLSESSRADLETKISQLGTNLLTVQAGSGFGAGDATLPDDTATAWRTPSIAAISSSSAVISGPMMKRWLSHTRVIAASTSSRIGAY